MSSISEFLLHFHKRFGTTNRIAKEVYSYFWSYVLRRVAADGEVRIRNFGKFVYHPTRGIRFRPSATARGTVFRLRQEAHGERK